MAVVSTQSIQNYAGSLRYVPKGLTPWYCLATATGDATGGTVSLNIETRPAGVGDLFVAVTSVVAWNNSGVTEIGLSITTDFELYAAESLWRVETPVTHGTSSVAPPLVTPDHPIYLGQVQANNGTLKIPHETNTDTKVYYALARGWLSQEGFVVPSWVTP